MKKYLLIIAVAAAVIMLSFSCKSKMAVAEKAIDKTIDMAVFTNSNYTSKVYDDATAGLTVTVKKAKKNATEIVWEESFPSLALKLFPAAINAFVEAIHIPAIQAKDVLEVSYTLTYNSKGSTMQMQGDKVVTGKQSSDKIFINI